MFNLTGSEILFLLVAGLVVLGPERLPGVIRKVGRTYGELRSMARNFEQEFRGTFDEPMSELRRTAEELRTGFGQIDTEPSPPMRPEQAVIPGQSDTVPDTESDARTDRTEEGRDGD